MPSTNSARALSARVALAASRALRATTLVLAGLVWASAAAAQTPRDDHDEMERPEVKEVRFRGVRSVDRGALSDALATHASGCLGPLYTPFCLVSKSPYFYERRYLDRTELARDVVRLLVFYYKRGWRDATVDTTVTRVGTNAVRVTFDVYERAPTVLTAITVDDSTATLNERQLAKLLAPAPGEPLNVLRLDSALVRLRDAYWERGYGDAAVARPDIAVDDSANAATVRVPVRRGPKTPIASVDIVHLGQQRSVSDETIRNSLLFKPGDLFKRSTVGASQRALYESGLFRSALIDTAATSSAVDGRTVCAQQSSVPGSGPRPTAAGRDSSKALVVCVLEGPLREARTSVGFSTTDFGQVEGRYTHNYWLGTARVLDISGAVGNLGAQQLYRVFPFTRNGYTAGDARRDAIAQAGRFFAPTYQAGIDVRQRWFQSPRNTIGAGVFLHRRSSPGVFVDRGQGATATFTRGITPRVPASATYRFEVSRVEAGDVYFCVNYGVCDGPTIGALQGQQRLSPFALVGSINTADAPFSPTRGINGRVEAEHASQFTISDFRYNRAYGDLAVYRSLPFRKSVLAVHGRAGWVNALGGTNAAVNAPGQTDGGRDVLHPRKRFYAGGSQSVRGYGENQLGPRVLTIAPERLRGDTAHRQTYCAPGTPILQCVGNLATLSDRDFTARPLGGTTLLEGSVELRVPVWKQVWGALFVDGAMLGERAMGDITQGTGAVTPGFGVRYHSPVGPIRVDVGFRPVTPEWLPVITELSDSTGRRLVDLTNGKGCVKQTNFAGCRRFDGSAGWRDRVTLHLSIGEAF